MHGQCLQVMCARVILNDGKLKTTVEDETNYAFITLLLSKVYSSHTAALTDRRNSAECHVRIDRVVSKTSFSFKLSERRDVSVVMEIFHMSTCPAITLA